MTFKSQYDVNTDYDRDQWWGIESYNIRDIKPEDTRASDKMQVWISTGNDGPGIANLDIMYAPEGISERRTNVYMTLEDMLDMGTVMVYKAQQALDRLQEETP